VWPLRLALARSAIASVAALALVGACGTPPGRDPPAVPPRVAPPAASASLGRWEHAGELGAFRSVARVRSQHLGNGSTEAELLANEVAAAYPALGPGRRLPPGSVLVERLGAAGSRETSIWFAMVRHAPADAAGAAAERWQFLVVRPDGELLARDPPGCARCHAEAPFDGVFGPPRDLPAVP
jgi:hypothetical protein